MCGKVLSIYVPTGAGRYGLESGLVLRICRDRSPQAGAVGAVQKYLQNRRCFAAAAKHRKKVEIMTDKQLSPCLCCTRVPDPRACDNKNCRQWRQWFLGRWELIRRYPRQQMDTAVLKPVGVSVGGRRYAPPHQVKAYLQKDPCKECICPKELCNAPCRVRRVWEEAKGETLL